MEKKEFKKKLSLNKVTIVKLEKSEQLNVLGGTGTTCVGTCQPNPTTVGYCDLPTIGHDDGAGCLSKTDWGWCWCYGR